MEILYKAYAIITLIWDKVWGGVLLILLWIGINKIESYFENKEQERKSEIHSFKEILIDIQRHLEIIAENTKAQK